MTSGVKTKLVNKTLFLDDPAPAYYAVLPPRSRDPCLCMCCFLFLLVNCFSSFNFSSDVTLSGKAAPRTPATSSFLISYVSLHFSFIVLIITVGNFFSAYLINALQRAGTVVFCSPLQSQELTSVGHMVSTEETFVE